MPYLQGNRTKRHYTRKRLGDLKQVRIMQRREKKIKPNMKIYGTAKGGTLSKKDFGVAFGGGAVTPTVLYPDSCESDADGTVNEAVINTSDQKFGDGCISFDGTDDYIACNGLAVTGTCGMNDKGTISVWCNFDTLDVGGEGGGKICAFGDADGNTFIELAFLASGALAAQGRQSGTKQWACYTSGGLLTTTGWYLCTITHDGTAPKLYVNAVEDTTFGVDTDKSFWVGSATGLDEFRLGMQYHSGNMDGRMDGLLDDIGIYDDDIGSSLISDLYDGGTGAKVSTISTDGCVAYYNCDEFVGGDLVNNATPTS